MSSRYKQKSSSRRLPLQQVITTIASPAPVVTTVISLFVFDRIWVAEGFKGIHFGGLFSDEDIIELVELGQVLRSIRGRLISEGKMIK